MTTKLNDDNNSKKQADIKSDKNVNGTNSNDVSRSNQPSVEANDTTKNKPPSNELEEHYKDLEHYSNHNNDHHPVPSLPPAAHHAPPEDSSELLSPWWSEEPPETTTRAELDPPHQEQQKEKEQKEEPTSQSNTTSPVRERTLHVLNCDRSATNKQGDEEWHEKCLIWTKEPSILVKAMETAVDQSSTADTDTTSKPNQSTATTSCTMVCLFRESLERKRQKRERLSSWNPFLGNWLVVAHTQSAVLEHIVETQIVEKDSPHYYTVEIGERLGRLDEDVTKFMKRTMSPVQELGRRYMESWKDGTQVGFFTRFMASAQRGDGFFLLRDSIRRMVENMADSDGKKNGGAGPK